MPWPRLPDQIMTDRVTLVRMSWGSDLDGGREPREVLRYDNVRAAVQPGTPEVERDPEQTGAGSVAVSQQFWVDVEGHYGLRTDDQVLWTDPATGRTHTLIVTKSTNLGGGCGTHQIECVERS